MCGIMRNMIKFTDPKDKEKREELNKLFYAWKKAIASKPDILFEDGQKYHPLDYFNKDGFYPGYFSAKPRILFIGRESRNCSKCDRIKTKPKDWLEELRGNGFWRRILYLVYGIRENGECRFEDIPAANEILNEMIKNNDYGFAFMNISKYSNDSEKWEADTKLINCFLRDSELEKRNFIREEIELLEPNIIITANLWDNKLGIKNEYLEMVFPTNDRSNYKFDDENDYNACLQSFTFNGREIKLVDTYHFSAPFVKSEKADDKKHFYDPVMKLLFK